MKAEDDRQNAHVYTFLTLVGQLDLGGDIGLDPLEGQGMEISVPRMNIVPVIFVGLAIGE